MPDERAIAPASFSFENSMAASLCPRREFCPTPILLANSISAFCQPHLRQQPLRLQSGLKQGWPGQRDDDDEMCSTKASDLLAVRELRRMSSALDQWISIQRSSSVHKALRELTTFSTSPAISWRTDWFGRLSYERHKPKSGPQNATIVSQQREELPSDISRTL